MDKTKVDALVNNMELLNYMAELFCRWEDEKGYEDIEDYGKAIFNAIQRVYKWAKDFKYISSHAPEGCMGVKFEDGEGHIITYRLKVEANSGRLQYFQSVKRRAAA